MTEIETRLVIIDEADLARLSARRQARLRRGWGRLPAIYWRPAWRYVWAVEARRRKAKVRRGRLLVRWASLTKRRQHGRIKKLAGELGVSRWTIWRDVRLLRAARLIRRQRRARPSRRISVQRFGGAG